MLRSARPGVWLLSALLLVLGLGMVNATVRADSYDERRVRSAARLFRYVLAADVDVVNKAGADGNLQVLVYARPGQDVDAVLKLLAPASGGKVRDRSLVAATIAELPGADAPAPAGVFLAAPLPDPEFQRLLDWSIERRVLVYSPFEGDVERGASAGIAVEAKVLPYVNLTTLEKSHIQLGKLFLDVAKVTR